MKITDLNGESLEVTDLDKTIKQAEIFKDYEHENKDFKDLDNRHKSYWNDLYQKLQILKNNQNEQPIKKDGIQSFIHYWKLDKRV